MFLVWYKMFPFIICVLGSKNVQLVLALYMPMTGKFAKKIIFIGEEYAKWYSHFICSLFTMFFMYCGTCIIYVFCKKIKVNPKLAKKGSRFLRHTNFCKLAIKMFDWCDLLNPNRIHQKYTSIKVVSIFRLSLSNFDSSADFLTVNEYAFLLQADYFKCSRRYKIPHKFQ